MISPNTLILKKLVFVFGLLVLVVLQVNSQCNPPSQLPTGDCNTAPFTCLNDACYETLMNFGGPPYNGWCGANTAIHNPQYFAFIAESPNVQINIHVDNCAGQGLQSAILGACPWSPGPDVIDCDPGTPAGGTMILQATLVPGQTYWLVIDGSAAALCQYTINFVAGIQQPDELEELDPSQTMAIPSTVCQGYDGFTMVTGPQIALAHGYYWVFEWDTDDTITSTLPIHTIDIPNDAPVGTWDICVRAYSGCDTTDFEVCFPITITEVDDVVKPTQYFCPEKFPFNWHGVNISGPGDYMATFNNEDGCPYDSLWTVEEYPEVPVGELDTLFCMNSNFDPFIYEGEEYLNSGSFELFYDNAGLNGCDSFAMLNLTLAGIDAFIEVECDNGEFVFTVQVQEVEPPTATLEYEWFVDGEIQGENSNMLSILADGVVTVDVTVEVNTPAGSCFYDLDPFILNTNQYKPLPPELSHADTVLCAQEGIFFEVSDCDPILGYEYVWTGPPGVEVYSDGSCEVEMDFSFTTGGQVCVYAINECGEGPSTCFIVDIIPTPNANFSFTPDICADSINTITFTGSASSNAELIWDFAGGNIVSGSGRGPYRITWSVPGDKIVELQVIEPGCDTAYASQIITVSTTQSPTINCTTTINSVEFTWNDVPGASGYEIFVQPSGPTVPLPAGTTSYLIPGLNPGTVVNITHTTQYSGPCPPVTQTAMCTAENCPPPTIELSGPDHYCLNTPTIGILSAIVNGMPGTGTWSGTGIVDPAGQFDPQVAGSGQHQLTYTVVLDNCPFNAPYIVNVYDSLTADFTLDQSICITDMATANYTGNATSAAQFNWDFGTATVVAGSGSGPYQLSFATPGSKPIRLSVEENGCTSDVITQNINVAPEITAPAVNCIAQTSSVEFCWPGAPNITYTVNTLSGHVGVQTGNCILFNGLVPGDVVEIEIISSDPSSPCPSRTDVFECEARLCPTPDLDITPVADICLYPGTGTVDLEITITNGNNGTGSWSGPGITDATNGIFDPNVAGPGAHLISYNYSEDGCNFVETTTINAFDPPIAFISNTSLVLTCAGGNMLELDGSTSSGNGITYEWTTPDGVISTPANLSKITVTSDGTYQLKVTSADGCVDSMSVVTTEDANTPDADAGPDRVITCNDVSFVQGGNSSTGASISYEWTTPDGNIVGANNLITATIDKPGEYTITVRDASNGCTATDRSLVTIDTAVASILLTPGDTIDCNTPISGVDAVLSGDPNDYTFSWTTTDGAIEGSTTQPTVDVSQGGIYTVTIQNKNNGCVSSASEEVAESDEIIDDIDASLVNITCFGAENGTIVINSIDGGKPPYTYQWSVGASGTDLSQLRPGTYNLTVSDANGCTITRSFTITEPAKLTADLGPNQTVAIDDSVRINLTTNVPANAIDDISWSGYDGLDCPGCPSLEFIASSSATFIALVTDTAGCTALDSMRLTVIVPRIIYVPTVFSPNGDDRNDWFTISGKRNLVNIGYLRIYDRWGNQVFDKNNLTPGIVTEGWNGRFNNSGDPMPPGVFVYVAELHYEDGSSEVIKGGITLIK